VPARPKKPLVIREHRDARQRDAERYRLYTLSSSGELRCITATGTLAGIGPMLDTIRKEGQLTNDSRVGIKDDVTRKWLINPYARGDDS